MYTPEVQQWLKEKPDVKQVRFMGGGGVEAELIMYVYGTRVARTWGPPPLAV